GGVRRSFPGGEPRLVGEHGAGPVAAVLVAELLRPPEQLLGRLPPPDREMRERALAGLRDRDPRPVAHAANALAFHHERGGTLVQPGPALRPADHAGEYRVVPVHRPPVLRRERLGPVRDYVGQPSRRQLPVGTLVTEML